MLPDNINGLYSAFSTTKTHTCHVKCYFGLDQTLHNAKIVKIAGIVFFWFCEQNNVIVQVY